MRQVALRAVTALLLTLAAFLLPGATCTATATATGRSLDCDPCIDRPTYRIKAITHGNLEQGLFWHQVRSAAHQAAHLLRVELEFDLYDTFDLDRMARDILLEANAPTPCDALLVTIPSPAVHSAIQTAVQSGIPVFGINSGAEVAEQLGLLGFLAMDEYKGGVKAAEQFIATLSSSKTGNNSTGTAAKVRALYVHTEPGNSALDERYYGFNDTFYQQQEVQAEVDLFNFDLRSQNNTQVGLNQMLQNCPYQAILLGGAGALELVTSALYSHGCVLTGAAPQQQQQGGTLLATFDTTAAVYNAIAVGKLHFAVSQQQHLQGTLGVVMAALYATTHKRLVGTNNHKTATFSTGPKIVTMESLPADTLQMCEEQAFPICSSATNHLDPESLEESRSTCPCTDLSKISIALVTHGIDTHPFWHGFIAQSYQAQADLGIDLQIHLQEPHRDENVLLAKMSNKIISLCREGVDGIVVSIPSEIIVPALQECIDLKVPIMSVNSGAEIASRIGMMHHIGQIEYEAGHEAGNRMVALGMKQALCPYEAGNGGLTMRCKGFRDAVLAVSNSTDVEWLGMPVLGSGGFDYSAIYIKTVEDEVERLNANWDGLGILLGASTFVEYSLVLKERYPNILLGTFDKDQSVYDSIAANDVLFGIDQGELLQAYLPIWLLTLNAYTRQVLQDQYLASGPLFIDEPQEESAIRCEDDYFNVCSPPEVHDYNRITYVRPIGLSLCGILFATSVGLASWTVVNRGHSVLAMSQPIFLVMLTFGTMVLGATIIPLSVDDGLTENQSTLDASCMATPWLLTVGFTITFSVLHIKLRRVNQLLRNAQRFQRTKITATEVMAPLVGLIVINVGLMMVWTLIDPMYCIRLQSGGCGEDFDTSSYGICILGRTNVSRYMFGAVVVLNFCALILALVEAYKAKHGNDALSERTYIFWNLAGMIQVAVVGVPLIALVRDVPVASYFVKTALVFVLCLSTLLLIFIPKIRMWKEDKRVSLVSGPSGRTTNGETGVSAHGNSSNGLMGLGDDQYGEDVDFQKMEIERLKERIDELEKSAQHTSSHPSVDDDSGCLPTTGNPT